MAKRVIGVRTLSCSQGGPHLLKGRVRVAQVGRGVPYIHGERIGYATRECCMLNQLATK